MPPMHPASLLPLDYSASHQHITSSPMTTKHMMPAFNQFNQSFTGFPAFSSLPGLAFPNPFGLHVPFHGAMGAMSMMPPMLPPMHASSM